MTVVIPEHEQLEQRPAEPVYPVFLVAAELIRRRGHANLQGSRLPGYTRDNHPLCVGEAIDAAQALTGDYSTGAGTFAAAVVPNWSGHENHLWYWNDYQGKDQVIDALERVGWLGR
jgi:hypothetical protein